jgi:nicotinamide-nucleotide amidase
VSDEALRALAEAVGRTLLAVHARAVTAESCTGGWIAKCLTDIPGSSRWFERGYVTYSNAAKQQALGVRTEDLQAFGAVSAHAAEQMASGALAVSDADIAVAVTGIAGPDGGTAQKPVGLVWLAVGRRDGPVRAEEHHFSGDREAIRRAAVATALRLLLATAQTAAIGTTAGRSAADRARLRRVFFALWPDEQFGARLSAVAAELLGRLEGRHALPADWHVTVCFVGSVNEAALTALQAGAAAVTARSCALQFDGLEYWQQARVVAATASQVPAAAVELAQALRALARSLGLAPDEKPLRPHLTLMRGVSPRAWHALYDARSRSLGAQLDLISTAFYLAESRASAGTESGAGDAGGGRGRSGRREPPKDAVRGASYSRLASWPLQG